MHAQVSKRYYNAHALVDVTLSAVFEPPLMDGRFPDGVHPLIKDPKIIFSVPTLIHKGARSVPIEPDIRKYHACPLADNFGRNRSSMAPKSSSACLLSSTRISGLLKSDL